MQWAGLFLPSAPASALWNERSRPLNGPAVLGSRPPIFARACRRGLFAAVFSCVPCRELRFFSLFLFRGCSRSPAFRRASHRSYNLIVLPTEFCLPSRRAKESKQARKKEPETNTALLARPLPPICPFDHEDQGLSLSPLGDWLVGKSTSETASSQNPPPTPLLLATSWILIHHQTLLHPPLLIIFSFYNETSPPPPCCSPIVEWTATPGNDRERSRIASS
ncbi:hypothetical protein VTK73DRAFT_3113 [Phialemonium thermophilum]|uniref:Uncharacterized protein n=1 Tax=Phialemonium thermophilum TaxID=223376 RepID=A0ABR3VM76_9PEZI